MEEPTLALHYPGRTNVLGPPTPITNLDNPTTEIPSDDPRLCQDEIE